MLRMITYGDGNYGSGMNTLLNSAASPSERCVSKKIAIENGTNVDKMSEFETFNDQQFPLTRLIPVWPVQQSQISTVCTPPYDSRTVPLHAEAPESIPSDIPVPQGKPWNQDSYVAGYDYTIEGAPSWFHYTRGDKTDIKYFDQYGYDYDEGFYYWADPLDPNESPRSAVVIVNATINHDIYDNLEHPCDSVCPKSRLTIQQGKSDSQTIASYTGLNELTIGFVGSSDATNTHINVAVVCTEQSLSGSYFANNSIYGSQIDQKYLSMVNVPNKSQIDINISKIKQYFPGYGGNITFNVYGTWEGIGSTSDIIPVPFRKQSWSVDLTPNSDITSKESITVNSCGNMNIGVQDIDSASNVVDKMTERCCHIATIEYNRGTDTITILKGNGGGIRPKFYPNTLSVGSTAISNAFVWSSSSDSTDRTFDAISVQNGILTVGVVSKDGSTDMPYILYMSSNTGANQYVINGNTTITQGDQLTINSNTFTIDLSNSSVYTSGSTHRFYLRQYNQVSTDILASGNKSPEYSYIQFTIQ